jgi:hypothetical protein
MEELVVEGFAWQPCRASDRGMPLASLRHNRIKIVARLGLRERDSTSWQNKNILLLT